MGARNCRLFTMFFVFLRLWANGQNEPPGSVSISAVNHTGPMLEGEQYQLQCEVQIIAPVQNLTVKWYKRGTENQTSYDAFTKTPLNVSSTLLITPTSADDGAQYSCVAELELGPEGPQPPPSYKSDPLNITVHYKPRITECPDYMKLTEGESLNTSVSCRAEGNPSPVVTWYRNQSEFNRYTQLTGRDAGLYVMTAENTLGSVNFTVNFLECPLKMEPSTVVVRYGNPVLVKCTVLGAHEGIGLEASQGSVDMVPDVKFVTWSLEALTEWEISPKCFGNWLAKSGPDQCDKKLNITVYKPPDSVSISAVNHAGPMLEGEHYQLQCEVQNIAPVQYLTVKWYKGETLVNQTSYDDLTKIPVNVSSTLLITPTSADDGAQYSCVAELELGPEGPQPPPSNKSDPLNITVNYAPIFYGSINETLAVPEGQEVALNCSALGNPLPEYSWSSPHNEEENTRDTLITSTSLTPGTYVYTCNAKNYLNESRKYFTVEVIVIVDYLPLIAGIVALAVVCISIAFAFIYLIYYKNTKMGEYNLKLGKSRTQNAHVAQNGKDSSLPMKKLTKPSLPV